MFVYVSNAEDGDIGVYRLAADGALQSMPRAAAAKGVMPMAISPDRRFLIAAIRSQPYQAYTYAIGTRTGALTLAHKGPLAESYPSICINRSGRFLLGASYGANQVGVNPIAIDGQVGAALHVIPTARNAHCIIVDNTDRFVFVPHLGTDQVFQFVFDAATGRLAANTPPLIQIREKGCGPRHIVVSPDNRFCYLLNELSGMVTTLALAADGTLAEQDSVSVLPPGSKLGPGLPRGGPPVPGQAPRNVENDIWASDLHLTPDGTLLYAAERTTSSLAGFRVDKASGKLSYLGSTPTEKQPRGFAIDPSGRFLVASGEKSDNVASYAIDAASGTLKPVGRYPGGKGANWVEIVSFD